MDDRSLTLSGTRDETANFMSLLSLRETLEGPSDDARFTAWMELYCATDPEIAQELPRVVTGSDPILKILLARFLRHMEDARAAAMLCQLLCDTNALVVDAARRAFEQNRSAQKIDALLTVLDAPLPEAQYFAIDTLALANHRPALTPLLQRVAAADGELRLRLLSALRHMPDPRHVAIAAPLLQHPDDAVRLRAVLIVSALQILRLRNLDTLVAPLLHDSAPHIRRAAVWCLRHQLRRSRRHQLMQLSQRDADPSVRLECLATLATRPHPELVTHLLHVLTRETDRMVLLKAEATLFALPAPMVARGLEKSLRNPQSAVGQTALLRITLFTERTAPYVPMLIDRVHHARSDHERVALLEALGSFGVAAIPTLEAALHAAPLVGYTAMVALLRAQPAATTDTLVPYLEKKNLTTLQQQMILKFVTRRHPPRPFAEKFLAACRAFTRSDNMNLRYLAGECLILAEDPTVLPDLLALLIDERNLSGAATLRLRLAQQFARTPEFCVQLIARHRDTPISLHEILRVMRDMQQSPAQWGALLTRLLRAPIALGAAPHTTACGAWLAWLVGERQLDIALLLASFDHIPAQWECLAAFTNALHTAPDATRRDTSIALPLPLLERWFADAPRTARDAILQLLHWWPTPAAIPLLTNMTCDTALAAHHAAAARILREMVAA